MREPLFNAAIQPSTGVAGVKPYSVPRHPAPTDLKLDANEGESPSAELLRELAEVGPEVLRRYPDTSALQSLLAERVGVPPECLIVTAGGDDSLDRLCRSVLYPGRELVTTDPGFEMLPRYARLAGAKVVEVPWASGPFPVGDVAAAVTPATSIVAFVSPNNPTGSVGTADDLRALAAAAPNAILLADFAYIEFADRDLTDVALSLPNCVVVRTLSKAYGLAGLRVGYAIGPREVIGWMRAAGGPYAVARPSVALAMARLTRDDGGMKRFVEQVRADRLRVEETLAAYGATSTRSQGNFVYTTMDDPLWVRDILAGLGIAIRAYPGHPRQGNSLRITLPGNQGECDRLIHALRSAFSPEAIIVPHEGVLESIEASTAEREAFGKLALRVPVGVCSNALRPAVDSLINRHGIQHLVKALVTEALLPPRTLEKSYLRLAEGLAARRVWALVTNRMEVEAARSQRMVPIAVVPKGPDSAVGRGLLQAGAAVVLPRLTDVLARLHNMPTAMLGN